jgi:diguanylate cyclase (GGDEF)-like protein
MGHDVGDKILQEVAQRLLGITRTKDTVARFGGDEFVILLPDLGRNRLPWVMPMWLWRRCSLMTAI